MLFFSSQVGGLPLLTALQTVDTPVSVLATISYYIQYRPADKKVPNENIMLTFWGALRKMG